MKIDKKLVRDVVMGALVLAAFFLMGVDLSTIDGVIK